MGDVFYQRDCLVFFFRLCRFLANNQLIGAIPSTMGQLSSLTIL